MKVHALNPQCLGKVRFARHDLRKVPRELGCYALANCEDDIMYVGQGVVCDRMQAHLDDTDKTSITKMGRAFWFYYMLADKSLLNRIEGGWQQQHEDAEGRIPILNKNQAPST